MKFPRLDMKKINSWLAWIVFILVLWILFLVSFPSPEEHISLVLIAMLIILGASYIGFSYGKSYTPLRKFNCWKSGVVVVIVLATILIIKAFLPLIEQHQPANHDLSIASHLVAIEIVLGLIVGYFVFHAVILQIEQSESIDKTHDALNELIKTIGVLEIIDTSDKYYEKLIGAIELAQDSISMIYLTKQSPLSLGSNSQMYWKWFQDYARNRSREVVMKRIASLDSDEKVDWVKEKTIELAGIKNYGIRAFKPEANFPPIMGLEIIDNKKVFLFGPHGTSPRWLYIENEDVAKGMAIYFDTLWSILSGREIKGLEKEFDNNSSNIAQRVSDIERKIMEIARSDSAISPPKI